jgi:hypothetical protein
MSTRNVLLITYAALLASASGCATLRNEFMTDTHAPIRVYDRVETRVGTERVATGESQTRDGDGNVIGSTTYYQNRTVRWKERNWYPIQGDARLDDESFYRIVGDQDAVQRYDEYHRRGVFKNKVGWGLLGGGVAVLGGSIAMYKVGSDQKNSGLSYGGYIGMAVGLVGIGVGVWEMIDGKRQAATADSRLLEDVARMKMAANGYNGTLMASLPPPPAPPPPPLPAAPPPPESGSMLPTVGALIHIVPVSGTLVGQSVRQFQLTADGSVWADGRKVAAILGSEIRNLRGELLFRVRADGAFVDRFGRSEVRFIGDELMHGHDRFVVSPDGRIVSVAPGGSELTGRVLRGLRFKRTVLVALVAALGAR